MGGFFLTIQELLILVVLLVCISSGVTLALGPEAFLEIVTCVASKLIRTVTMVVLHLLGPRFQLNFLASENRRMEIVDPLCERVQTESLDSLLSVATQCVSSNPDERPTMHRVVQILESEVMTPCPSDFYDSD